MPKSILCLDLATALGFCHWNPGSMPTIGSKDMAWIGGNLGKLLFFYEKWLREFIIKEDVDWVTFESPFIKPVTLRSPGTPKVTAMRLMNLCGIVERICYELKIPCSEVTVGQWRKHFIGRGDYPTDQAKEMAVQRVTAAGYEVKVHDEAEAFGIMDYVADELRIPKQWKDGGLLGLMR